MQNETLAGGGKNNLSFLAGAAHLSEFLDNQQGDQQVCKLVIIIIGYVVSVKIIKTVREEATFTDFNNKGRAALRERRLCSLCAKLPRRDEPQLVIKGKLAF